MNNYPFSVDVQDPESGDTIQIGGNQFIVRHEMIDEDFRLLNQKQITRRWYCISKTGLPDLMKQTVADDDVRWTLTDKTSPVPVQDQNGRTIEMRLINILKPTPLEVYIDSGRWILRDARADSYIGRYGPQPRAFWTYSNESEELEICLIQGGFNRSNYFWTNDVVFTRTWHLKAPQIMIVGHDTSKEHPPQPSDRMFTPGYKPLTWVVVAGLLAIGALIYLTTR